VNIIIYLFTGVPQGISRKKAKEFQRNSKENERNSKNLKRSWGVIHERSEKFKEIREGNRKPHRLDFKKVMTRKF